MGTELKDSLYVAPPKDFPAPDWSSPQKTLVTISLAALTNNDEVMAKSVAWVDAEQGKQLWKVIPGGRRWNTKDQIAMREAAWAMAAAFPADEKISRRTLEVVFFTSVTDARFWKTGVADIQKSVQKAQVKIAGDTATLLDGGPPARFQKVDGVWKAVPESFGVPADEKGRKLMEIAAVASEKEQAIRAALFAEFTKAVRDKVYTRADEALAAFDAIEAEVTKRTADEAGEAKPEEKKAEKKD
jgi:hypothetical protein